MQLTNSQSAAQSLLLAQVRQGVRVVSLSGAAGTGKTTMINSLVESLAGQSVAVCTPTNKAAQVLRSKGIVADTFYKIFYILEEVQGGKPRFISCQKYGRGLPPGKLAHVDVLIIDEASMLTSRMAGELGRMCNTLVLVGDHNQLPPVGDRDYPAGMFSALRHTATLTEVLRQAEGSLILTLADAIRSADPKVEKMLKHFEPQCDFRTLVEAGAQMIAYTNRERQRINLVCRKVLGYEQPYPQVGDKMLVTNNYSTDLINGTVVEVLEFEWDGVEKFPMITVKTADTTTTCAMNMAAFINDQVVSQKDILSYMFEDPTPTEADQIALDLTFGYCLTCHKSQGSEWDDVVVFDQRSLIKKIQAGDKQAGMSPDEYVRRWTYTAATRARKNLYIAPTWFAQASVQEF